MAGFAKQARIVSDITERARFAGLAQQLVDAFREVGPNALASAAKEASVLKDTLEGVPKITSAFFDTSAKTANQWNRVSGYVRTASVQAAEFAESMRETADAIAALGSVFTELGMSIGSTLDDIARMVDAVGRIKEAGTANSITGTIDVAGFLGGIGGLVGSIANIGKALFGTSQRELEQREQQKRLAEAISNLAARVSGLAGTAQETRLAGVAVNRILSQSGGLGGTRYLNSLIADLGLSMADLSRIANDLGISLYNNGKLSTAALKTLAEAIGLNTELLTRFGREQAAFRSVQEARRRIFDLEDTPALAIQDALAEIGNFAPEVFRILTNGIDSATPAGRQAIEAALRDLFTRLTTVGTSLEELGTFTDINQLLDALLRLDDALDGTASQFEQLNNLNVPQGFKVALARFNATAVGAEVPTPPSAPNMAQSGTGSYGTVSLPGATINFNVQGGNSPDEALRFLAEGVNAAAPSNPQLRLLASILAPYIGRN